MMHHLKTIAKPKQGYPEIWGESPTTPVAPSEGHLMLMESTQHVVLRKQRFDQHAGRKAGRAKNAKIIHML
jgi:hypothetical protein